MITDATSPQSRARLRELAAKARAETFEPGWPYDGTGDWTGCVDGLLGGITGEFAGAMSPDVVCALLDALDEAEKAADTQSKVAAAFKQALTDEYRPHVEQNKAYGMALDVQEKQIAELRGRAEKAEAALARVRELVVWSDPARLGGTPCVRGTRTPVDHITALLDDFSDEEITGYYPTPEVWQVSILRALDGGQ